MPLIYRAANIIDAQLVLDQLLANGLQARATGHYLSGAIGELPPEGIVGIWLLEAQHVERARAIIDNFEASRQRVGNDRPCQHCGELLAAQFERCWQCGTWTDR